MSGKASAVFWIGLFLIFANFWISGQSTQVWRIFTGVSGITSTGGGSSRSSKNGLPLSPAPPVVGP